MLSHLGDDDFNKLQQSGCSLRAQLQKGAALLPWGRVYEAVNHLL